MSLDIYNASAGSGKTYTLTREYLQWLLSQPSAGLFRSLLAVTFTNKAAGEMKSRILTTLNKLSAGKDKDLQEQLAATAGITPEALQQRAVALRTAILHDYSHFAVSTIDKFFQKIIRGFMHEAGLLPGFTVELDTNRLLDESIERLLQASGANAQLRQWLGTLVEQRMDDGRHWDIRGGLRDIGREVFKESFQRMGEAFREKLTDKKFLSGYIREIKNITAKFEQQMQQTGRSALQIMKDNGLTENDFKYKNSGFIHHFHKITEGDYEPKSRTVEAIGNLEKWYGSDKTKNGQIDAVYPLLNPLLVQSVTLYEEQFTDYNTAREILKNIYDMGLLADIADNITHLEAEENSLSINDSLLLLFKLIDHSDTPFIYEKTGAQFHSFMLDEFQDTSSMQWNSLKPLLLNSLAAGGKALAVGDVKQSIYRWRNGDWRILAYQLDEDFNAYGTRHITLNTNWRSSRTVVDTNNRIFAGLSGLLQQRLNNALAEAGITDENDPLYRAITHSYKDASQQTAPGKEKGGYVCVEHIKSTDDSTAQEIALQRLQETVAELIHRGYALSDIAVLVRSNKQGQVVADALLQKGFSIISQDSLFISRSPVVQFITATLYAVAHPNDNINRYVATRYLSARSISEKDYEKRLQTLSQLPLIEAVENIIQWFEPDDISGEMPFIQELHDIVLQYASKETNDIFSFVEWWKINGDQKTLQVTDEHDAIRILTIHKSKGLQFRVTIVPFCNWPLEPQSGTLLWVSSTQAPFNQIPHLPLNYSKSLANTHFSYDYALEKTQSYIDNLNLLYVALTRAEDELYVFCPEPAKKDYTINSALAELWPEEKTETGQREPIAAKQEKKTVDTCALNDYPSYPYLNHLRLKHRDEATKDWESKSLRDYGILMHRAFSAVRTPEDIDPAVDALVQDGFVPNDPGVTAQLRKEITEAIQQPGVQRWFDGNKQTLTEMNILLPGDSEEMHQLRPDRVMLNRDEVEVVDYKFGELEDKAHLEQIKRYISCLYEMGYTVVKGYLWYVNKQKITIVDNN